MNSRENTLIRRDVPEFLGSRTAEQRAIDRKTVVYDDSAQTVRVSNLLDGVTREELKDLFSDFGKGKVKYVKVPIERDTKTGEVYTRGFGFVTFVDKETAVKALEYDNLLWNHTRISVKAAKPRRRP